jgi:hypothetical protein
LPEPEQLKPHWKLALEILISAAEHRDMLMHVRIAMLHALNNGKL